MSKAITTFGTSGVGEVNKKAFTKGLPEGLNEEHFMTVDDYRDQFVSKIATEALDEAQFQNESNGSHGTISVNDINLGGRTIANITVDNNYKLVVEFEVKHTELMNATLARANELYSLNSVNVEE